MSVEEAPRHHQNDGTHTYSMKELKEMKFDELWKRSCGTHSSRGLTDFKRAINRITDDKLAIHETSLLSAEGEGSR
jgi:hypothetical protein